MTFGGREERAAEAGAEVPPLVDAVAQLGDDLVAVRKRRVVTHPPRYLLHAHLRMELHAPRAVAEPKRL